MTIPFEALVLVYLAFVLKHLLGDYVLQTSRLAVGKGAVRGWLRPLAIHAGTHAAGTLLIALAAAPSLWWLGLVDFAVHGLVDRTKANAARGWVISEPRFWWAFGLDQTAHQLTHFAFVLSIVARA